MTEESLRALDEVSAIRILWKINKKTIKLKNPLRMNNYTTMRKNDSSRPDKLLIYDRSNERTMITYYTILFLKKGFCSNIFTKNLQKQ